MKYMMVISYDGSKFHGFQRQKNQLNIQSCLEKNLSEYFIENIIIKGAGRTDRGVHAYNQVIHFETNRSIKKLKKYLNNNLENIKVKKIKKVSDNFHARYNVKEKIYLYKIALNGKKNGNYYLNINYKLNINLMKKASKLFIGTHNFKNFVSGNRDNYESTINRIKIYKRNNILYLKFIGIGFYRYMVRNLVGALLEVGKEKIKLEEINFMLNNPEIEKRLPTSSPNGLYLVKIKY